LPTTGGTATAGTTGGKVTAPVITTGGTTGITTGGTLTGGGSGINPYDPQVLIDRIIAGSSSREEAITNFYRKFLGRDPTPEELRFGGPLEVLGRNITTGPEYMNRLQVIRMQLITLLRSRCLPYNKTMVDYWMTSGLSLSEILDQLRRMYGTLPPVRRSGGLVPHSVTSINNGDQDETLGGTTGGLATAGTAGGGTGIAC
jgi:hypothetical protein